MSRKSFFNKEKEHLETEVIEEVINPIETISEQVATKIEEQKIEKEDTQIEKKYRICVRNKLSVYQHPTIESDVIAYLQHGTIVTSNQQKNAWLKITLKDKEGWIMKKRTVEV